MKDVLKTITALERAEEDADQEMKNLAARLSNKRLLLANAMREARKKSGISLRSMAKQLGISASHLSDMERNNRRYSPYNARAVMSIISREKPKTTEKS